MPPAPPIVRLPNRRSAPSIASHAPAYKAQKVLPPTWVPHSWPYFLSLVSCDNRALGPFRCVDSNIRQVGKQIRGPTENVVVFHRGSHAVNSRGLFLVRHFERTQDCRRYLLHVIRIHLQRIGQFERRPSK